MSEFTMESELLKFSDLWNKRPPSKQDQTKEAWNTAAKDWSSELDSQGERAKRSAERVGATVDFLRQQGVLTGVETVADVGCGPCRFAVEFAKHAGHVTAIDLSDGMLDYGAKHAEARGLTNMTFTDCDFQQSDVDEMGWRGAFDLAFASITPALSCTADLDRMMAMSRQWCFSSNFVSAAHSFDDWVLREIAGGEGRKPKDGMSFYSIFNILWLRGYFPIVRYYSEHSEEVIDVDRHMAERMARRNFRREDRGAAAAKIYELACQQADKNGQIRSVTDVTYGWLLWNVNRRQERSYSIGE